MGDARRQHAGLAGAGAGQHQHRPVQRLDRAALLGIEPVEIAGAMRGGAREPGSASGGAGSGRPGQRCGPWRIMRRQAMPRNVCRAAPRNARTVFAGPCSIPVVDLDRSPASESRRTGRAGRTRSSARSARAAARRPSSPPPSCARRGFPGRARATPRRAACRIVSDWTSTVVSELDRVEAGARRRDSRTRCGGSADRTFRPPAATSPRPCRCFRRRSPAHLAHGMLDRHAGFGADEQQVDHVGIGAVHRLLALGDLVAQEDLRRLDAEIERRHRRAELHHERLIQIGDRRTDRSAANRKKHDRRARGERPGTRFPAPAPRKPAIASCILAVSVLEPAASVERVDDLLGQPLGCRAQRGLALALARRGARARAARMRSRSVADRLDAARQVVRLQHRHRRRAARSPRSRSRPAGRPGSCASPSLARIMIQHGAAPLRSRKLIIFFIIATPIAIQPRADDGDDAAVAGREQQAHVVRRESRRARR